MSLTPFAVSASTADQLEALIDAALAPLTSSIIVNFRLDSIKNAPVFTKNLYAEFGATTTGAVPLTAPFEAIQKSAPSEDQVLTLLQQFITANPTYFITGPFFIYRPESADPNEAVTGLLVYCTDPNGSKNWPSSSACVFGIPLPYNAAHILGALDNGNTLILTGTPLLTINTGLASGFGCAIKGDFTYGGTATVTDVRESGAINPWCALVQTGTNTYDLVGNKV